MTGYVGIDVSKDRLDVVLLRGEQKDSQHFTNTTVGFGKLQQWLTRRLPAEQVQVCLEATGRYSEALTKSLYGAGYRVSVVNPARIKGYGQAQMRRNKTDQLDAALIADFCRAQQPEAWTPVAPEVRDLQALVRHLEDLTTAASSVRNRLALPGQSSPVSDHLQAQLTLLEQQIAATKHAISDHLDQHPSLKQQADLLRSIPGLGDLTIGKLLAECRDLRSFTDPRQLVAFAGLNPAHHSSGSSIHHRTHISKTGSASLRTALYMPALSALRHNPVLIAFAQRLRSRGIVGKVLVVAVMRKLLHLVVGVLKSQHPFDPLWAAAS